MTRDIGDSDEALMLAVRRGDLDALDLLFARHQPRLYGFLVRLTADKDLADDLVQEVFLRLLRHREKFNEKGRFTPWLFRIARNLAMDRMRNASRNESADEVELPNDDAELVIDTIVRIEDTAKLERVLATLPMPQREILLLKGTEKMSHKEIAMILECSEAAARVRVHRALAALRKAWFANSGEPG